MTLEMRTLDPVNDLSLFSVAYGWRAKRRAEGRMSFEDFVLKSPGQVVLGLFNGQFLAVYVVKEFKPHHYDMHFTSKRNTPREYLVAGGIQVTSKLIRLGAIEVSAVIRARNLALKRFLEDCGYSLEKELTFDDSPHLWLRYVAI